MNKSKLITLNPIILILLIAFLLNAFGSHWGLPYRLNPDEHVARTLRMIKNRSLNLYLEEKDKIGHPTFYNMILGFFLVMWLGFLKIIGTDFTGIISAASVSWIRLAQDYPWFATSMYVVARLVSAFLGTLSVFLTFLIAKKIFNKTVALWASAILAFNMGFVNVHHFAKNTPLVIVLSLFTILFCIKALQEKRFLINFALAALVAGLAIATKLDGAISLVPLFFTWLIIFLRGKCSRILLLGKGFFSLGIIGLGIFIGWPSVFYAFEAYRYKVTENTLIFGLPETVLEFFQRVGGDLMLLMSSYNVVLFIPVIIGLIHLLLKWRRYPEEFTPLKYMLVFYLGASSLMYLFRSTKFIILSFPILSIIAANITYIFFLKVKSIKTVRLGLSILTVAVVLYSLAYCVRADLVFAKNDTRYLSTEWIKENIKEGSSITIFTEPLNYFLAEITQNYRVSELKELPEYKISSDILIHSSWEHMRFESGLDDYQKDPQIKQFFDDLLSGENARYRLRKKFEHKENIFWNPRPSYTSPVIYIFEKSAL